MKKTIFLILLLCGTFNQIPNGIHAYGTISTGSKTSNELFEFLKRDQTDKIPYSEDFNCVQFSDLLVRNARAEGFQAVSVIVTWPDPIVLHQFVAFYTSDKGIIWIEPQNDSEYRVIDYSKIINSDEHEDELCHDSHSCINAGRPVINIEYVY